jgi:hypothetical protein
MKHPEIGWNPVAREWFCVRCFRTSDHLSREEAVQELSQFECVAPHDNARDTRVVVN